MRPGGGRHLNSGATMLTLLSVITSTGSGRKTSQRSAVAPLLASAGGVAVAGPEDIGRVG